MKSWPNLPVCSRTVLAEHFDRVFTGYRGFIDAAHRAIVEPILPKSASPATWRAARARRRSPWRPAVSERTAWVSPRACRAPPRRKARERKLPLRVIQADMRDFRLPEPVDLILSEYDAINHVPRHSDLRRVSSAVAGALNPGGWFFFDVNN